MPTYQYACKSCEQPLEVVQGFNDARLTVCPACGGELRQVFSAVGVVFKGSGFYRNDSRGKATSETKSTGTADTAAASSDSAGASTKDSTSKEAAPSKDAAAAPAASTTPAKAPKSDGGKVA